LTWSVFLFFAAIGGPLIIGVFVWAIAVFSGWIVAAFGGFFITCVFV
jgi:hypothetical protein